MQYFTDFQGNKIDLPVGKVVCVGQNYQDHIDEMASKPSASPLLFMKPSTAISDASLPVAIPQNNGECHNELEVALLIAKPINRHTNIQLEEHVWGIGLALDLTLREVQKQCKSKGHPWERAKSFDGSCPVSSFVKPDMAKIQDYQFQLKVNGDLRQSGNTANMIFDINTLLNDIAQQFTLLPGDLVLTGTPKGVAALTPGDRIEMSLADQLHLVTEVVAWT